MRGKTNDYKIILYLFVAIISYGFLIFLNDQTDILQTAQNSKVLLPKLIVFQLGFVFPATMTYLIMRYVRANKN